MRSLVLSALVVASLAACETGSPLVDALPALPPTGGPAIAAAGRLTAENFARESVSGPASGGLVGDFFMRNDKVRVVVQAPGRAIGPCPYGGNIIDLDWVDHPVGDQLGEVSAMMQLGRTVNAVSAEIVRDGSQGGPAVLRFTGRDAWDDFINLRGIGGITAVIDDENLPSVELGWQIAETYILQPGESSVRVVYTFYNPSHTAMSTSWGTISDSGADIQIFHAGVGYGELSFDQILTPAPTVTWLGLQGVNAAYGVVPVFDDPSVHGADLPTAGVAVEVYDVGSLLDGFGDGGKTLTLDANGTASRELRVVLGHDLGDVDAEVHALHGETTVAVGGVVGGNSAAGARVAASRQSANGATTLETTFTADANGRFAGALPAGQYVFQAEGASHVRSPAVDVVVPNTQIALPMPDLLPLRYAIHDRASGEAIGGKVIAIGSVPNVPSPMFRDVTKDILPHGFVDWSHSLSGVSTDTPDPISGADRALRVPAGHYRVVVSHGPEWSRDERELDVVAPGAEVDAVLDHVVPTPGYAACDFHQHSHKSPDSQVPPEARVLSYVAEGVDFASTSEHDFVWDLAPVLAEVGATGLFDTAVGIETTTWDYGHYIGFPLTPDPRSPNFGAPDWAGGENIDGAGLNLPPPAIFERLRAAGAEVVQVTHPRATTDQFSDFQASFDRAGLTYDFASRSFGASTALQPVSLALLALAPDAQMFAPTFDTVEVYNGYHVVTVDGERHDSRAELVLRDWMNFLSFGFAPTPTGVSDTHTRIADPAGMPRTLVAVADDSPQSIAAGLRDEVIATLKGQGVPKDVVVTNGPFLRFSVDGAGIGRTVVHQGGPLAVHVEVHAPAFTVVDTVEVYANATFDLPSDDPAPLMPVLCFTSVAMPSARCASAIGGARPLTTDLVVTVPGAPSSTRRDIVLDAEVSVDDLVARNRAGATGRDVWMVARATGTQALYPSLPNEVTTTSLDDLVAGAPITTEGVPPMAFTNAIFVDTDGGGWRAPFQP